MRRITAPPCSLSSLFLLALILSFVAGCGGGKASKAPKKEMPAPTWMKVNLASLPSIEGDDYYKDVDNNEEGEPRIRVYDPQSWSLSPNRGTKGEKGRFVIGFQKGAVNLCVWGRESGSGMWDEESLPALADAIQEKYGAAVKMVRLGDFYGVTFARRSPNPKRPGRFFDKQIVLSAIAGRLYLYEAIAEEGKLNDAVKNALFSIVAKTKVLREGAVVATAMVKTEPPTEPAETLAVTEMKSPLPETSVTGAPPESTPPQPIPAEPAQVDVAIAPAKPETKPETKPTPKPPAKASAKTKSETKNILSELDDLLSN